MGNSLLATIISVGTIFFVIGLVLYRLLWSGPFLAALSRAGVLPQSWRRWILGEAESRRLN